MKKRFLMMLPLVALVASCGDDPMAGIRQSLPNDLERIDQSTADGQEEAIELLQDALTGLMNFKDNKAVYHLSVDVSYSMKQKVGNYNVSASSYAKGDLYLGYEMEFDESEVPTSSFFVKLENLTVGVNMKLPEEVKKDLPIPENFSINNFNLYVYGEETEDGTIVYADLSDHTLQDYAYTVLELNGFPKVATDKMPAIDDVLNDFLGAKDESGYRPGKVKVNVSDLLTQIDERLAHDALAAEEEYHHMPQEMIEKPLSYFLCMGKSMIEEFSEEVLDMVAMVSALLKPTVGAKWEEESGSNMVGLVETAFVVNASSSQFASQYGISESELPVHGYLGLMVRVGLETGADEYALEEIKLSANASFTMEEISMSLKGSIGLTASYNEQATLIPVGEEAVNYRSVDQTITNYFFGE